MIYAIKSSIDNSYKLSYFRAPAFLRSSLTGLYSTGAYIVLFGPFKEISFEEYE